MQLSKAHRVEGEALQEVLSAFDKELRDTIEEIWKKTGVDQEQLADSWAARMQEKERDRLIEPIERVQKPEMGAVEFSLDLLRKTR